MEKQNCWQFKNCGRQPGGARVKELGICPAAMDVRADGMHNGINGGRVCWALAGTLCGGEIQGTFAMKLVNCISCEFFKKVRSEEGAGYIHIEDQLDRLKQPPSKSS